MTAQSRKDVLRLFGLFAIGQLVVGALFTLPLGPVEGGDSYLSIARDFPDLTGTEWSYGGYVAILALGEFLGSGPWFAFVLQSVAAIAAGLALLSLGRQFSGSLAGWVASAFYLLYPLITQWSSYLLTESLFYSGVIITAWCLVHAIERTGPSWWPLWATTATVATLRPNGVLLVGSVASVLAISCCRQKGLKLVLATVVWVAVLVGGTLSPTANTGSSENWFGPRTWIGDVVWNVAEERIEMPQPVDRNPSNAALIRYALDHPIDMVNLGSRRVWWELKQVRPWYSPSLNLFTSVTMIFFYLVAAVGAWTSRRSSLTLVTISITLPFMTLIAVTWAVWEGRFGWWFLVLWTVWAGIGTSHLIQLVKQRLPCQRRQIARRLMPQSSI